MFEVFLVVGIVALAAPLIIGALYVALWPRVENQIEADDNI